MRLAIGRVAIVIGCALSVILTGGCQQMSDFLPRTHTTSVSPDGQHTAFVRQGLNVDPPDDHFFLTTRGRPTRLLMNLAPDADWCKTIIWTSDSRIVGCVIADERVVVFDVETGTLQAFFYLVGKGCCGGRQEARHVAFNDDGTEVSFERFDRPTVMLRTSDGIEVEAPLNSASPRTLTSRSPHKPARSLGREAVRVPVSRVRLRLVRMGAPDLTPVWVKLVANDERWIDVPATPSSDGLVVLPAFHDGPLDRIELGFPGQGGRRTVLRDLTTHAGLITVNVPSPRAGG